MQICTEARRQSGGGAQVQMRLKMIWGSAAAVCLNPGVKNRKLYQIWVGGEVAMEKAPIIYTKLNQTIWLSFVYANLQWASSISGRSFPTLPRDGRE